MRDSPRFLDSTRHESGPCSSNIVGAVASPLACDFRRQSLSARPAVAAARLQLAPYRDAANSNALPRSSHPKAANNVRDGGEGTGCECSRQNPKKRGSGGKGRSLRAGREGKLADRAGSVLRGRSGAHWIGSAEQRRDGGGHGRKLRACKESGHWGNDGT